MLREIERAIEEVHGDHALGSESFNINACQAIDFFIPVVERIAAQQGLKFWLSWGMNTLLSGLRAYKEKYCQ